MGRARRVTDIMRDDKIAQEKKAIPTYEQEVEQWKKNAINALANYLYALTGKQNNKSIFVGRVTRAWMIIEQTIRQEQTQVEYRTKKPRS